VDLNHRLKRLKEVSKREQANPFVVGVRQTERTAGSLCHSLPFRSHHLPTESREEW
jgi:hypothetical protein